MNNTVEKPSPESLPSYITLNTEGDIRKVIDAYLNKQERIVRKKTPNDLKNDFDVIDEHELAALAGVDVKTVRQWRTRRIGPMYINVGKSRLYFKKDVADWFRAIRKETAEFDMKVAV